MPYVIVTAETSLQLVDTAGAISTLTLPSEVTISNIRQGRFAILDRNVVVVGAPSKPLFLDDAGLVRPVSVANPTRASTAAAGAAGSLTGTFGIKWTNLIKDPNTGTVLVESAFGPDVEVTVSSQAISQTLIPTSGDTNVNARRCYRTAANGTLFFQWFDLDDNITTSFEDGSSDESLSLLPAPTDLGLCPPRLDQIVEWKGRLWARNAADIDNLYATAARKLYAWPLSFPVKPQGGDVYGITGFLPRRDELGILKNEIMWKMTGDSESNFKMLKVIEGKGTKSPDTCRVIRDVGYWLGNDGVYAWDSAGVRSITDDTVHPWFNTDTYFARGEFPNAISGYDPITHSYVLGLSAVGSTVIDRWVTYDIAAGRWLGPHKTAGFTLSAMGQGQDSNANSVWFVGSTDGYLHKPTAGNFTDSTGTTTAIDFDVTTKFHAGDPPAPDIMHYFGMLSILTKIATGTLTITPKVGGLDASSGAAISHTLTTGRQRLRRLGVGRLVQLNFRQNVAEQGVEIYGYEIPWHEVGQR